jgi:hypothetical protein
MFRFMITFALCFRTIGKAHGQGHSQNAGLDSAMASSLAPYYENDPTLGLYPTWQQLWGWTQAIASSSAPY